MINKLKAFTLMEVMVVLVLSSIIIGMTYNVFDFVNKQIISYRVKSKKNLEINTFITRIEKDFFDAYTIQDSGIDDITLDIKNRSVNYIFKDDFILRKDGNTKDTFFIENRLKGKYYENINIYGFNQTLDRIIVNMTIEKVNYEIAFYKEYTPDVKLQTIKYYLNTPLRVSIIKI